MACRGSDALSLGARNGLFGFTDPSGLCRGHGHALPPSPPTAAPSCPPHLDLEMLSKSVRDHKGPYFKVGDSLHGPTSVAAWGA